MVKINVMIEFLKSVTIFKDLEEPELGKLLRLARKKNFTKGETVFQENDFGRTIYVVFTGLFQLTIAGRKICDYRERDVFGEFALINENLRSGKVTAMDDGTLLEIKGSDIISPQKLDPASSLSIIRELARKVTSYLHPQYMVKTMELIHSGENERIEFKSSLRYNYYTQKFGREIEHAALKTIAAFLNSKGGTLLIGVNDKGEIKGIEADKFENEDKTLLHLTKLISDRIGSNLNSFVRASVEDHDGKKILRIDVDPSTMPAYLKDSNNEYLYIRTGPSTTELKASEIFLYVYTRFFALLANKEKT